MGMASSTQAVPRSMQPERHCGSLLIGPSEPTRKVRAHIARVAPRPATVLLEGETGVGKELAAREIHRLSRRGDQPFVPVDCTALASPLIESQLFGHEKGAFTGAVSATLGFIRCADGGTLFLDEIGELPLDVQAKLLRCIQERSVVPVGGVNHVPVDVRIVAATHRDLAAMVREESFRQDLYFRLNVVRLNITPLRERPEDIAPLAVHFLEDIARSYEEPIKALAQAARDVLVRYDWPGNARELRNAMERAHLFCGDRSIDVAHLPKEVREGGLASSEGAKSAADAFPSLAESERLLIARALKVTSGNQSEAARLLRVERHRLRRKIVSYRLEHLLRRRPR